MATFKTYATLLALSLAPAAASGPGVAPTPAQDTGCTTTSTVTQTRYSTYPFWQQCEFDGTARIYPSTVTALSSVDCNGCQQIQVRYTPLVNCPLERITATKTETTASTRVKTVCLASGTS